MNGIKSRSGCLFVFEGLDGSGKTTQVRLASANLTANGVAHTIVESPGRSRLGLDVRDLIARHDATGSLTAGTEALLHFAILRSSLDEFVLPALSKGRHVLMDRSHLSTAAYQGAGDTAIYSAALDSAASWLQALQPTKVFYLDIAPQMAAERIQLRGDGVDKYDNLPLARKKLVRERYLSLGRQYGETFVQLDAGGDVATISQTLLAVMLNEIEQNYEVVGG